jgi:hypothetical protein
MMEISGDDDGATTAATMLQCGDLPACGALGIPSY